MPKERGPRVLALVPGRGGSKGLPRRNVLPLAGHPLIAWSIAAGRQAVTVDRVICSTDDAEIAEIASSYGAEVPFMRPAELSQDDTLDLPVFQHAVAWLEREQGWRADVVVQLRPTSPLRFAGQLDEAVRMLLDAPEATGVRTVIPAPCNPFKMWLMPEDGAGPYLQPLLGVPGIVEPYNAPRQKLPQAYWQTGTIDAIRADVIRAGRMSGDRMLPMVVDSRQSVDIDAETDLVTAAERVEQLGCLRP